MPDVFDQVADAQPDVFDHVAAGKDIFDQLAPDTSTPATDQAVKETSLFSRAVKGVGQAVGKMAEEFAPLAVGDVTPLVNMVVPNKQDVQAFTPSSLAQRTKIGSPEYFEQVTNYAVPVATLGVPLLRGKAGEIPRGGEVTDASQITGAESVPESGVRTQVGEEAPLQQQGETPQAQPQEEVAPPKITKAAVRNNTTGEIYTGTNHPEIYYNLRGSPNPMQGHTGGFIDQYGNFYDMEQAAKIAKVKNKELDAFQLQQLKTEGGGINEDQRSQTSSEGQRGETGPQQPGDQGQKGPIEISDAKYKQLNRKANAGYPLTDIERQQVLSYENKPTEGGVSEKEKVQDEGQGQAGVLEPSAAAAEQPAAAAPVGGANVKAFERIYGEGEIPSHGSVSPEEEWTAASERARTGKANPYGFVDRARTGAITPDEMGDLIYEHQRLVTEAANAEGTPQYEELYSRARDYAENVVKPAENAAFHRTGMVMQIKPPVDYTRLTGFRAALEKRMGREMTPEEAPEFQKIANEVNGARRQRDTAASQAMGKVINRFKGVKDISFEDAVKQVHDALKDAAKPCKI